MVSYATTAAGYPTPISSYPNNSCNYNSSSNYPPPSYYTVNNASRRGGGGGGGVPLLSSILMQDHLVQELDLSSTPLAQIPMFDTEVS